MPSFPRLVELLADEAGESAPDWEDIPSDTFLGRIERDGFKVHERVARLVTPSQKQGPNTYHESILGLFRDPSSVRIETTNHDPLLTIAADNAFGNAVELY
jgi:hypothetical protein